MRSPSPDPYPDAGTDSTQPQTQPQTVPDVYDDPTEPAIDPDCWGLLVPCSSGQPSGIIQLKKKPSENSGGGDSPPKNRIEEHTFKIGRGSVNDFTLPGQKISSQHCTLTWSGRADDKPSKENAVVVLDTSSNGTFINGKRIGKGKKSILRPGDELSFGLPGQDIDDLDYRYMFRRPTESVAVGNGVFQEYELGPALGRGAFATVRRALHRVSGQWFACKVITKSRLVHNPRSRQMFQREVAYMKEFDHPHICKLVAHFEDESTIWLILELITGGDLLEAVLTEGGLCENETRQLAMEMCLAIEYSHSKHIVHRDLKPENVLLTDTVPRHAKIADFGLAKAVDSGTFLKTFCGTPTYLAPEVVLRAQDVGYNELVDSWSLGVIVWSMLTNTVPFTEDDEDMVTRFQRRQVEWSQVSGFGLSNECIDWMQRMLVPDPARRMRIAEALDHPWLADLSREHADSRPPTRGQTTPTDAASSVANSSNSTSFVSSDPPSTQELRELERFNDSMILDEHPADAASALGSASLVSGAVSVVSGVTATTHTSDASNLRLVSKFSEDSDASLPIPGKFPHSPMPILNGPHPLRTPLQAYETPQNFVNMEAPQVPGAPIRKGQAPMPVPDDSMQTDSSWDQVSGGAAGESTMHPNLQTNGSPFVFASPHTPANLPGVVHVGTPNGQYAQTVNGKPIQPPHLQFEQSPQVNRQLFNPQQPNTAPYQFRLRNGASPLRPQQPRERVIPAHPGPMREPLPVAPSSPVASTPTSATTSNGTHTGLDQEDSDSELSDVDEDPEDDHPRGPTGTVRQKRHVAPTRVSSRVRARRAAEEVGLQQGNLKMPITGIGARRSGRRHTPMKAKIH
ncbi:Serine/threonine-protein kinase [Ceratobasidium sp. AG-Ba]|nr:Serine/threonine-protein kinase [Ceratobasidium sp. AG-Ba]